jgi:1,4-dihydroxy-2-naphthoyl-CoA hydrolase
MSIWFKKDLSLSDFAHIDKGTMAEHIGMEWVELGEDFLAAKIPVDQRTRQPYGLLHGGASVVLAETLGSVGAAMVVDDKKYYCVGLEINANHLRSVRAGFVTGIARPIHTGASTHVWDIRISDERGKLVCISRLTVAILKIPAVKAE